MKPELAKAFPDGTSFKELPSPEAAAILLSGTYFANVKTTALRNVINHSANNQLPALIIEGDVNVNGHFLSIDEYREYTYNYSMIVIKGNLTVNGTLQVGWNEEGAPFIVLGNLTAQNLITTETLAIVQGNATINGIALLMYEAYLIVNGELNTKGYFCIESSVEASGNKSPEGELGAADFIDELIFIDPDYEEDGIEIGIEYNKIKTDKTIAAMYAGTNCLLGYKRPPIDEEE